MRRARIVIPVFLLAFACTDAQLGKVAKSLDALAISVGEFQTLVITANNQGLLSFETTWVLLDTAVKVNEGGLIATKAVKQITALTPADRTNLIAILRPVIGAVSDALAKDVLPIKNEPTRQKVQLALLGIQSTLNTINLVLAGGA